MDDSHLIRVLRAEMRRQGMTQNRLALAAGLQKDAVRNVFRRTSRMPRMQTVKTLAEYLGLSVDYLLGREAVGSAEDVQDGADAVPRLSERKPGLEEWQEPERIWNAASPDIRRALIYLARIMAKAEGIGRAERQPGEQRSSSDNA